MNKTSLVDIDVWVPDLLEKLKAAFKERLLFLGLQGSYRRGEATADSDIDVVTVFDSLSFRDLELFKKIVDSMPHSEKACGFICGREELEHWPKFEIFQLVQETRSYWGDLGDLAPSVTRADIIQSVKISASAIYHASGHSTLHGQGAAAGEVLKGLLKTSFFVLQLLHYLRSGRYARTKKELRPLLTGLDRELLAITINGQDHGGGQSETARLELLMSWSAGVLKENL